MKPPPLPGPAGSGSPPPLPPSGHAPHPPDPVRVESAWEFHADERVLDACFAPRGHVRVMDAMGTLTEMDATGRVLRTSRLSTPLQATRLLPSGAFTAVTADGRLLACGADGEPRADLRVDAFRALGANARMVVVAEDRRPMRILSPTGRPRTTIAVAHAVDHVAPCSLEGEIVALASSGQFSVFEGGQVRWTLHLRASARALVASDTGIFVVVHADGAQAFTVDGLCLGLFDPGVPLRGAALSGDGSTLMLLADERLFLVDPGSGYCTWNERRPVQLAGLRLAHDGRRAMALSVAGSAEMLLLEAGGDRTARIELLSRPPAASGSVWRHAAAVLDVDVTARVAVAPGGDAIAVSRDGGAAVELHDARGTPVGRVQGTPDLVGVLFSADGRRLVLHGARGLVSVLRDGRARATIPRAFARVLPGTGDEILAVGGRDAQRLEFQRGADVVWDLALPEPARALLATPSLQHILVAGTTSLFGVSPDGRIAWRHAHACRQDSVAAGGPGWIVAEPTHLVGLSPAGETAFRVAIPEPMDVLTVAGHAFGRAGRNRFWWIGPDGEIRPVDASPNLGSSLLITGPSPDGTGYLELNVNGRALTAFALDGRIAWRCEAPAPVSTADVVERGGLLAFRAAASLCLLPLHAACTGSEASRRAAFIEF